MAERFPFPSSSSSSYSQYQNLNPPPSPSSSPFQNMKPSVLIIVLILSITVLLSISLCLLLRHLNRRCIRNLPTSSTISTAAVTPEVTNNSPVFSLIDSLPVFPYSSIKRRSSAASSGDCAVCLSKFEQQDELRLLPLCCHAFHVGCIDTWLLQSNQQTCPLCRSPIHSSEADILKAISSTVGGGGGGGGDSFRLEIGSISRRRQAATETTGAAERRSSYSFGSFDYVVDEESEVTMSHTHRRSVSDKEIGAQISHLNTQEHNLAAEVGGAGRNWLKEYVDRLSTSLSSRALSFRSSGGFFTGSSRRSEIGTVGDYDVEASYRVGEEISEMFRWFSGV